MWLLTEVNDRVEILEMHGHRTEAEVAPLAEVGGCLQSLGPRVTRGPLARQRGGSDSTPCLGQFDLPWKVL